MSVLDTRPCHNPHLFSYAVSVHEFYEVGHISIQERVSSVSSIVATVNFLCPEYQRLQVVRSSTSVRKEGWAGGRAGTRGHIHHHSFCCFTGPGPQCTTCPAAVDPAELLSQAPSIAGVSSDLPVRHSLGSQPYSLAFETLF